MVEVKKTIEQDGVKLWVIDDEFIAIQSYGVFDNAIHFFVWEWDSEYNDGYYDAWASFWADKGEEEYDEYVKLVKDNGIPFCDFEDYEEIK